MEKKNKWGIRLRSNYTGETITLGSQYDTYKKAQEAGEHQCHKCNSVNIIPIPLESEWADKETGFVSKERFKKMMEANKNAIKRN